MNNSISIYIIEYFMIKTFKNLKINIKQNSYYLLAFFFIAESIFWASQITEVFLDVVSSINETRPHRLQIAVEYFIDQQKYFYLILLHMNAAIFIGALSLLTTGTLMIMYLRHTCGMFRIARYELKYKNSII